MLRKLINNRRIIKADETGLIGIIAGIAAIVLFLCFGVFIIINIQKIATGIIMIGIGILAMGAGVMMFKKGMEWTKKEKGA